MEIQLDELLKKIQTEGVQEAEKKATQIINEAEAKASQIISQARQKADTIVKEAEQKALDFRLRSEESLKQASRDLILNLKQKILNIFENLLKDSFTESLKGNILEEIIKKLLDKWLKEENTPIELLVSPQDALRLSKWLIAQFASSLEEGIQIKPVATIEAGFRIGIKDNAFYYDLTAAGLASMLKAFVNEKIASLLSEAAGA